MNHLLRHATVDRTSPRFSGRQWSRASLFMGTLSLLVACSSPEATSVANGPVTDDSSSATGTQSSTTSTSTDGTAQSTGSDTSGSGTQPTASNTGTSSATTSADTTTSSTGSTTSEPSTTSSNGAGLGGSNSDDDASGGTDDSAADDSLTASDDSSTTDDMGAGGMVGDDATDDMGGGDMGGGDMGGLMGGGDMGGEGMGGMPGTGGDMGGGSPGGGAATPSAGCGGGPQSGTANVANSIVSFPPSYDGSTPIPMVFGFHGAGRTNDNFRTVDARTQGTAFEDNYVMVYLKSNGNDWTSQLQGNVTLFNTAYDTITNDYCIDTSRVFAIGHSSGAQFISNLLCQNEDRLTAVGPVASSRYCMTNPATPTFYIQGRMDQERGGGNGQEVVDAFVASNGCQNMSAPYDVGSCQSGGTMVDPGCVEYQGCSEPMFWCSHNDPNYSNTNHGWPCFANDVLFDFFQTF